MRCTVLTLTPCAAAITRTPGRSFLRSAAWIASLDVGSDLGPTQLLALVLCPPQAGAHPLLDHRPLELGEHAHHLEHGLAGRRRGVEALLVQKKVDAERVQLAQEPHKVLKAAAQAIDTPGHDHIELAARRGPAQRIERRALVATFGAADAVVFVDLGDLAAHAAGDRAQLASWVSLWVARTSGPKAKRFQSSLADGYSAGRVR